MRAVVVAAIGLAGKAMQAGQSRMSSLKSISLGEKLQVLAMHAEILCNAKSSLEIGAAVHKISSGRTILETKMAQSQHGMQIVRKMWSADSQLFADHLKRLDPKSRRLRFGMGASEDFVSGYAARALQMDGVTYGCFIANVPRAVAELRPFGPLLPREAEAAFSVEAAFQDSGIGTELMERIILAARNRGIKTLYMNCLAENRRMQHVARKFDAQMRFEMGDVVGELKADYPTPFTLWREAVQDGTGFVMAVMELNSSTRSAA